MVFYERAENRLNPYDSHQRTTTRTLVRVLANVYNVTILDALSSKAAQYELVFSFNQNTLPI